MGSFSRGMGIAALACGLAAWAMASHKYYLIPIDAFTFSMGLYSMVRSRD